MRTLNHTCDVCVVGGGLAGMCASLAAARHGCSVILIHDRPVFGGNASSEIRMWPLGAHGSNRRETGIFEELVLTNMAVNPLRTYPEWDAVLYAAMRGQAGLTLLMNCSVHDADVSDGRIRSVSGWQLTTYTEHVVTARLFIDCSGDSILGHLSGAEMRRGREARDEFGEEAAPPAADEGTMGNSLMIQAEETGRPVPFTAPPFARVLTEEELRRRSHDLSDFRACNWWWLEIGGEQDTLYDCEDLKDELLGLSYGIWDHVKNRGAHGAENWALSFAGYLPGKRESFRCVGDHILRQSDVAEGTHFDDTVAYGGWTVDDHPPMGFRNKGDAPNRHYPSKSPFEIPYRCLYSVNVDNLMFAGRNISVTHAAMAASRVMATCAVLGQAAGTAAAAAVRHDVGPRGVLPFIREVQKDLMDDDCWLPGFVRPIHPLCAAASLTVVLPEGCGDAAPDPEPLRDGVDRPVDSGVTDANGRMTQIDHGVHVPLGASVTYTLPAPAYVRAVRLVFDSDLDRATVRGGVPSVRDCPTICNRPHDMEPYTFPATMTDTFDLLADGEVIRTVTGNRQRLCVLPVGRTLTTLTLRPRTTCGAPDAHVFSFDFDGTD